MQQIKKRIGILLGGDIEDSAIAPLKFLILRLNTLQSYFEYEFLPAPETTTAFFSMLGTGELVNRRKHKKTIPDFLESYRQYLTQQNEDYRLTEALPDVFVVITMARFDDEYYLTGDRDIGIIALGNWKSFMAPPSLLEFILTMVIIESVYLLGRLPGIGHLGTKGCLFDFNASVDEARYGAMQGFICTHCRQVLATGGYADLPDALVRILDKSWFGSPDDNLSVAGVVANFKYDLFLTKGIKPTNRELFFAFLREDGVKELMRLVAEILLAAALFYLGFKKGD